MKDNQGNTIKNLHDEVEYICKQGFLNTWYKEKRVWKAIEWIGTGKRVLDIGCRWGHITEDIAKRGNEVTAIDFVEKFIKEAKEVNKGSTVNYLVMDAYNLKFKDKSFDVVFLGETFEHLIDPRKALKEIRRVLKEKGYLIMTTPNFASLRNRIKTFLGHQNDDFYLHIKVCTRETLEKLLKDAGFKVEKIIGNQISFFNKKFPCPYVNFCNTFIVKAVKA
jgi:O-antigen biosynthesis protein